MDIIQFAEKHLGLFKQTTNELQVKKCPFCDREKGKFYVNINTGNYFCHSGSCNAKGNFERLKEKFGVETTVKFKEKKEIKKIYKRIAKNIKDIRTSKKISQEQMALSMGFTTATFYTNAESLKRDKHFNLEHIIKISKILNIDIQELFKE